MSRCVLITSCGDPFILLLLLKLFKKHWYEEVDKVYININNHAGVPLDVISELIKNVIQDNKVQLIYHPEGQGNGPPFVELVKIAKEDLILMLEDDFFIFTSGVVDKYFKMIEDGKADILGSPRYTHGEAAEAAKRKYNLDYSGAGDKGFGWWPTGFFCKRADLLKTDLNFGSKEYRTGEHFKELDYTFKKTCYTDTFTWLSIQLRYLGLKSISIPQYHADPFEIESKDKKEINWIKGKPCWIHGGSLSAGWGGYLSGQMPMIVSSTNRREIESRVAFWQIASDVVGGFDKFKVEYKKGIEDLIVGAKLDRERIKLKYDLYKNLMEV